MLRALKVGASTVERAHLPAEETKPGKARGRALACENLAQVSYQSFVVGDAQSLTAAVEGIELAKRGVTMQAYRNSLSSSSNVTQKQLKKNRRKARQGAGRDKLSGWNVYLTRRGAFAEGAELGSEAHNAELQRLSEGWKRLTDAQRAVFDGQAVASYEGRAEVREQTSMAGVLLVANQISLPANALRREKRRLVEEVAVAVRDHPAWQEGLGLASPHTGLAAEHAVVMAQDEIDKEAEVIFEYDPCEVPNGKGPARLKDQTCHRRFFGLCCTMPTLAMITTLVHNIHVVLKRWNVLEKLPVLVNAFVPGTALEARADWFLTHAIGKGNAQVVVKMQASVSGHGRLVLDIHNALPTVSFMHLVLHDILQASGIALAEILHLDFVMLACAESTGQGICCFELF